MVKVFRIILDIIQKHLDIEFPLPPPMSTHPKTFPQRPSEKSQDPGFRFTPQRRVVLDAIACADDHPTAADLYTRVQKNMPHISLATVYNCLETLSVNGYVRQVNVDRAATRYCLNDHPHAHFSCDGCGAILDVELPDRKRLHATFSLPPTCVVVQEEISLRGLCPDCAQKQTVLNKRS